MISFTTLIGYFFCSLLLSGQEPSPSSLSLQIENLQSTRGSVHIAVYDREESFVKSQEPYRKEILRVPEEKKLTLQLDDLPAGRYAVAVYHDENDNDELDKNLLGIPKEAYGFSNNPHAKWSAPKYNEISFAVDDAPVKLVISVKKWKER